MKNFSAGFENLLDSLPIAIVSQDFLDNRIIINNEARKLLNVEGFSLSDFKKDIESMRSGTHRLTYGSLKLSVDCVLVPMKDSTVKLCTLLDIGEQIYLKEKEEIYRACLESITDMNLFACDAKGTIILYNRESARSDNTRDENIVGKNMYEVFGYDSDTAVRRALTTGEPVLDWESVYDVDGKYVRNVGSAYPIIYNGSLVGAFSINRSYEGVRALLSRTIELQKQLMASSASRKNGTSYSFDNIIGNSEALNYAKELALKAANSPAPVLIYGETGTGKELFAQSIHNASVNRDKPFVAINCAAIPDTLLESTLFGTVKGAFTGADNVAGLFEQAADGTLFLDEINSLPLNLQAKLLRVIQERVYRRVGGKGDLPVKCGIISSCNCSPLECVENGSLRKDLYYRLAVVCIEVPPLRSRKGDVMLLVNHFLNFYASVYGVSHIRVSKELATVLSNYSWPGNVRELRHVIESSLLLLSSGEELNLHHFPEIFVKELKKGYIRPELRPVSETVELGDEPYDLKAVLSDYEREAIVAALKKCGGNVSKAAKQIGYNRTTLQYQMEKLQISAHENT